ncbi:MAG: sodium-dependent transporter [Paludibacteraceae bacterium]|nr:sodium-dependent transporter [Paludibacteraceae bacterium]
MARNQFASKFGTMAAIAGSAVGLGNIWKFPYVAGQNGGAAFLIIYIVISLLISVPVMLSEFVIGRRGQGNTYRSFINSSGKKGWGAVGAIEIFAGMVILAFYCVVAGWSLEYIIQSVVRGFGGMTYDDMSVMFDSFVNSSRPVLWTLIFLAMNCIILAFGVSKGIERCSKFMIPALFLILLLLAVVSIWQDGWAKGAAFLLKPDWSAVTYQTVIMALGQSFFSLSLGMSAMTTYGSYIQKDQSLVSVSMIVTGATVVMAVLAGLAIFPSVFTYGVEVTSGPNLVFKTLPPLFATLPGGRIVSVLFFILLFFAAITSSFSLLEAGAAYISEEWKVGKRPVSRVWALIILFVAVGALSVICAMSQVEGSTLKILGFSVFDFTDMFTSNFILPLGGIAACILVGQLMNREVVFNELTSEGRFNAKVVGFFYWLARYVCPIIIFFMFINGVGSIQRPQAAPEEIAVAYPTAEYKQAEVVLMHTPGSELFDGVAHPAAGLFEGWFDVDKAADEHRGYIATLRKNGCEVYTVRDILASMGKDSLEALAMRSLTYEPEDLQYKMEVINQMSKDDLIRCILYRPTVVLSKTDKNTGVEAIYKHAPLSNLYFLRDQSISTPRGVVLGRMNSLQRANEVEVVRMCYAHLGIQPAYEIKGENAFLEGGDYFPFGTMSLIGCGMRTTQEAINQLMEQDLFGHDTVVVVRDNFRWQAQMHLDTYFNIIDRDLVTMCSNRYDAKAGDKEFVTCDIYVRDRTQRNAETGTYVLAKQGLGFRQWLEERGVSIITISQQDADHYANNFLTIAPRHICAIQGQSMQFAEALRDNGVMVDWIPAENLIRGYGAAHCMTQVIRRGR